jgi:beta-galactosidase
MKVLNISSIKYALINLLIVVGLIFGLNARTSAQNINTLIPEFGAEVFIEPGQTPLEIDTWFKRLKENHMTITRIRMFESYMHKPDGSWDYALFDLAFKAADKYGIKIYSNLFPATSSTDVGGFKFPRDEEHLKSIASYIKNLVTHFKQFKSCYGWVPINEPGSGRLTTNEFSRNKFNEWKNQQPVVDYTSKGYNHLDFSDERFLVDYNTWFLKWLTDEIHKYDPESPIHVNNHAIFQNAAEYNFPAWRGFLTSLGGSAHASWHFGYFNRSQYALAMSANSEILRSGAGSIPWIMTEMQGGNNTYSGGAAMCPTKEEISQWLWTTVGTGSKGAIFWCLNPRASGFEAGEWAMLDFQNEPSDRFKRASEVASVIQNNADLFARAKVVESGINILYVRESMWVESKLKASGDKYEGRDPGGVMKSALGYFEALSEMGLQSNFKEIAEFDFSKNDYKGTSIILAHQIAIPSHYWDKLNDFVFKGGKLIVDGLTAFYDENALCIMKTGFPLEKLFGGNIKEFKLKDNLFELKADGLILPVHLWQGTILTNTAIPIGNFNNETIASRNKIGKGEVLWIPSLLGLGSRIKKDYSELANLLSKELKENIQASPISFENLQKGFLMKTLKSDKSYISIIINKSKNKQPVQLNIKPNLHVNGSILYADKGGKISNNTVDISSEETVVVHWK